MRLILSALSLTLAITQSQAQSLTYTQIETASTPMILSPYGAQLASWALSPGIIAVALAAGSYGLQSLLGSTSQSQIDTTDLPANKLVYHWEESTPLTVCSKNTFQLATLPSKPGSQLIITELPMTEKGDYCAYATPVTPKGAASLHIYSDGGQIDTTRSSLTINDQPIPLAQLQQTPVLPHTQGNHLTLTSNMLEGHNPAVSKPIQLSAASPVKQPLSDGDDEADGDTGQPPPCEIEIYKSGKVVAVLPGNLRSWDMERVVIKASERAGYEMDWHMFAGRHVVKTLGDIDTCYSALMDELDKYEQTHGSRLWSFNPHQNYRKPSTELPSVSE